MSKCKVWTKGSMGEHSLSMHRQGSGRKFEDWKRRKVFLAWVVTIRLIIMLANWNENFTEIIWISICMRLFNLINFFYWNIQSFTQKQFEKSYIIVIKKWGYVIYHTVNQFVLVLNLSVNPQDRLIVCTSLPSPPVIDKTPL